MRAELRDQAQAALARSGLDRRAPGSACWPTRSSSATADEMRSSDERTIPARNHQQPGRPAPAVARRARRSSPTSCASSCCTASRRPAATCRRNLGTVELTIALHYVYNTPHDRIVWDVGHQTYPHKILTGRRERMSHAAPARRHQRLSAARRERVRHLRHRAFVDLDLGRARHGGGGQAQGRGPQGGRGHRRRRDERRHGVRGAQQRRRLACRHAGRAERQRHVDLAAGRRAEPLPRAPDERQVLRRCARHRQDGAEERAAAVRAGAPPRGACQGHGRARHDLRGVRLQLRRPDRRPRPRFADPDAREPARA